MLVFTDQSNHGQLEYQTFPETSDRPHIVVSDPQLEDAIKAEPSVYFVDGGQVKKRAQAEIDAAKLIGLIAERKQEVDLLRARKIAAGMPYAFPDGQTGTIQLRSQGDIANVQGVASSGQALVVAGDTATTLQFRDAENVSHSMTGQHAIDMGLAVSEFISSHYQAAWAHKDDIGSAVTAAEVEAHDVTAGWPS